MSRIRIAGFGLSLLFALAPLSSLPAQCFRRGDSNCDGRFDLSDAITTLSWLFTGGAEPCCLAAADPDGDGVVNITDPIYSLGFLFLGGPPPRQPFEFCGPGSTSDALGCRDYPPCPQVRDCFPGDRPPQLAAIPPAEVLAGEELVVQASAIDPDPGEVLVYSLLLAPPGMTAGAASGKIRWTPGADQIGAHDVTVTVEDRAGAADFASFTVRVHAPQSAPRARDDSYITRIGESLEAAAPGVLENDADPDGDPLRAELVSGPTNGALDLHPDGSFRYTPFRPGFDGNARRRVTAGNLTILAAPKLLVSSQGIQCPSRGCDAEAAADDELGTSWLSVSGDAAPFYEVVFEDQDVTVREVRIFGNREVPTGFDVLQGQVKVFSRAGAEIFSSGLLDFPEPDRDLVVEVGLLEGAYRVRLSITAKEGDRAGISEMQVIGDGAVFALEVKQKWVWDHSTTAGNFTTVISTPLVIDLDGDGTPEVVFPSGQGLANSGFLRAVHGTDGTEVFTNTVWGVKSFTSLAAGDLDGDGRPEILALSGLNDRRILAFDHRGEFLWQSDVTEGINWGAIAIADLDGDGSPEILIGRQVLDAAGHLRWTGTLQGGREIPIAADLDLDGRMEVIDGGDVYRADGSVYWQAGIGRAYAAVGNFDDDPYPEVVVVTPIRINLYNHDGSLKWGFPSTEGTGAPTLADFDGDGQLEIGLARTKSYLVLDGDGKVLWQSPTSDYSSAETGSSVFDFDGDGTADVVYRDEVYLRVFRGTDGRVLLRKRFHSATADEYPLVADVDGDGHADIVVPGDQSAPIGPNAPPGSVHGIYVYTGLHDDWVRTRPIWNEHSYHVTNVNLDGTIPRKERPNWLVPGLNHFRLNEYPPDEDGSADRFTYRATDGALVSAPATVVLELRPPNSPPEIVSAPAPVATVGFLYLAHVRAVDPDRDPLIFALSESPAGMSIDPDVGLLRWTPTAAGDFPVAVRVTDDKGEAAFQRFVLHVAAAVRVPDVRGLDAQAAEAALAAASLAAGRVTEASDPAVGAGRVARQDPPAGSGAEPGRPVDLVLSSGPSAADIDNDGDSFSERDGDCGDGDPGIHPGAVDIPGDGIDQDCDGEDASSPVVEVAIEPGRLTLLEGETATLAAFGIAADGTSRVITLAAEWSSSGPAAAVDAAGRVTAVTGGSANVRATLGAVQAAIEVTVAAALPSDDRPPLAEIISPLSSAEVLEPVDIIGTVTDDQLVRYELAIAPAGDAEFIAIGGGNAPVVHGVLGRLDPTLLVNDLYDLRLTALDRGGNRSTRTVSVQIKGDQKIGAFRLAFVDLTLPLPGLPITVSRVYDSRDKRPGDFGVGWRLEAQSLRLRSNRVLGTGWSRQRAGLTVRLAALDEHKVSLTLPGGQVEEFDLVVSPPAAPFVLDATSVAELRPRPGTLGRLEALESGSLAVLNAGAEDALADDQTLEVYDPRRFLYTSAAGVELEIDRDAGLVSARDPNGNLLTFSPDGIRHSSDGDVGFERDALGRITRITDRLGREQTYGYDAAGNLVAHVDAAGNTTRFAYDRRHGLLRIIDPLGRTGARSEYDDEGRLTAVTGPDGARTVFDHDLDARREVITDPAGNPTVIAYDDHGRILEVTDALSGVTSYTYDAAGNQVSATNPLGETSTRTFDDRRNVLSVSDDLGETTHFEHDERGLLTSVRDPLGRVTTFTYDARGNLLGRVNAAGAMEEASAYDGRGLLLRSADALGNFTEYAYDAAGNLQSRIDARGYAESFTHDAVGDPLTETDRRGGTVKTEYDARGLFTIKTDPLGHQSHFTFDAQGNFLGASDPTGRGLSRSVDESGRDREWTDPQGVRSACEYDVRGNLVRLTDAAGHSTTFEYDALGRRTKTTYADGVSESLAYDAAGRNSARTDPDGNVTRFEYDRAGRLVKTTDALGGVTRIEYDAAGNAIRTIDPLGHAVAGELDALGRLVRRTYEDGAFETYEYDAAGRRTRVIDPAGNATRFEHDAAGNLVQVIDAAGGVTRFALDPEGRPVAQTDAEGRVTTFEYDALGRLVRLVRPGGGTTGFEYDLSGNLVRTRRPDGRVVDEEFDSARHRTARIVAGGGRSDFAYTPTGKLASVTGERGTTSFAYDLRDRLAQIVEPDGARLEYAYDPAGELTATTAATPGAPSRTTRYAYDRLRRLSSVTDPDGRLTRYGYDATGNLTAVELPNGVVTSYAYDVRNRLVRVEHRRGAAVLERFDYSLDAVGDRTRVDSLDGSRVDYEYDVLRRLTRETRRAPGGVVTRDARYEYDGVGNRLREVVNGGPPIEYAYDIDDRLLAMGGVSFAYDAAGNVVARNEGGQTTRYAYDPEGRLVEATPPSGTAARYAYDALGRRMAKTVGEVTVRYLQDPQNLTGVVQVAAAYDEGGLVHAAYVHGLELLMQDVAGAVSFYHRDGTGSVRLLTDPAGNVTDRYTFDAFGRRIDSTGSTPNPYLFAGEEEDPETGLYYMRARHYSPETGRFLSEDPFGGLASDPVTLHRYLYSRANPVSFRDPEGRLSLLAQTVLTNALVSGLASAFFDVVVHKKSGTEVVVNAIVSAGFGALGGALGSGVAAGFTKLIQTKFLGVIGTDLVRRGTVFFAVAFVKAGVSTLVSVGNLYFDAARGASNAPGDGQLVGTILFTFGINFIVELLQIEGALTQERIDAKLLGEVTESVGPRVTAGLAKVGERLGLPINSLLDVLELVQNPSTLAKIGREFFRDDAAELVIELGKVSLRGVDAYVLRVFTEEGAALKEFLSAFADELARAFAVKNANTAIGL